MSTSRQLAAIDLAKFGQHVLGHHEDQHLILDDEDATTGKQFTQRGSLAAQAS